MRSKDLLQVGPRLCRGLKCSCICWATFTAHDAGQVELLRDIHHSSLSIKPGTLVLRHIVRIRSLKGGVLDLWLVI